MGWELYLRENKPHSSIGIENDTQQSYGYKRTLVAKITLGYRKRYPSTVRERVCIINVDAHIAWVSKTIPSNIVMQGV